MTTFPRTILTLAVSAFFTGCVGTRIEYFTTGPIHREAPAPLSTGSRRSPHDPIWKWHASPYEAQTMVWKRFNTRCWIASPRWGPMRSYRTCR
jgi:hypothetical protein